MQKANKDHILDIFRNRLRKPIAHVWNAYSSIAWVLFLLYDIISTAMGLGNHWAILLVRARPAMWFLLGKAFWFFRGTMPLTCWDSPWRQWCISWHISRVIGRPFLVHSTTSGADKIWCSSPKGTILAQWPQCWRWSTHCYHEHSHHQWGSNVSATCVTVSWSKVW